MCVCVRVRVCVCACVCVRVRACVYVFVGGVRATYVGKRAMHVRMCARVLHLSGVCVCVCDVCARARTFVGEFTFVGACCAKP